MSLEEAALLAASEVEAAGGSFKCLRLQQSGNLPEAAAAAAAEAAGKQALKHRKQQHQPKIVCHALDDLSSEGDDDTGLQPLDSCGSNMSSMSALTAQTSSSSLGNEWEASTQGRVSSSSSSAGSVMMMSLPSVDGLLTTMYRSFSSWRQTPTAPAV